MRTFFAITPDPATQLAIENWYRLNWSSHAKPVPAQNYHITLAFLGETNSRQQQLIDEMMSGYTLESFDLRLNDTGYWPDSGTLWLGTNSIPDSLTKIAEFCVRTANNAGIKVRKKTWHPHVTLARKVTNPPAAPMTTPEFVFQVSEITLMQSILDRSGARYLPVQIWGGS